MEVNESDLMVRFKVGLFSLVGLLLVGATTVLVNDRPFWWRSCQLVHINILDGTGLKMKSPVRSLGLQIGYLNSVELYETHVRLGICITAPVDVLPSTRAFIKGEGFLGDKFVELKPVRYIGEGRSESEGTQTPQIDETNSPSGEESESEAPPPPSSGDSGSWSQPPGSFDSLLSKGLNWIFPSAEAADSKGKRDSKTIPVGESGQDVDQVVKKVNGLVQELQGVAKNLKEAINPTELRGAINQLNKTLEVAGKTLSPEGNLTRTAQRALAKLEDAIEQLRDQLTRINQGQGPVGKLLNDPYYAQLVENILKSLDRLLNKVSGIFFIVNLGASKSPAFEKARAWFQFAIWPTRERYYLLGVTADPRGKVSNSTTTTTVQGGSSSVVSVHTEEEEGFVFTGMLGKVFWQRLDLSVGFLHGDGTVSMALLLGPSEMTNQLKLRTDIYSSSPNGGKSEIHTRLSVFAIPFRGPYLRAVYAEGGMESLRKINGKTAYYVAGGITFDDEDIKMLFTFL